MGVYLPLPTLKDHKQAFINAKAYVEAEKLNRAAVFFVASLPTGVINIASVLRLHVSSASTCKFANYKILSNDENCLNVIILNIA